MSCLIGLRLTSIEMSQEQMRVQGIIQQVKLVCKLNELGLQVWICVVVGEGPYYNPTHPFTLFYTLPHQQTHQFHKSHPTCMCFCFAFWFCVVTHWFIQGKCMGMGMGLSTET